MKWRADVTGSDFLSQSVFRRWSEALGIINLNHLCVTVSEGLVLCAISFSGEARVLVIFPSAFQT